MLLLLGLYSFLLLVLLDNYQVTAEFSRYTQDRHYAELTAAVFVENYQQLDAPQPSGVEQYGTAAISYKAENDFLSFFLTYRNVRYEFEHKLKE